MAKGPVIIENNGLDAPEPPDEYGVLWESRLEALKAEREAYVKRGLDDRVKAVDAEIERLGFRSGKPTMRSEPAVETARETPAKGGK